MYDYLFMIFFFNSLNISLDNFYLKSFVQSKNGNLKELFPVGSNQPDPLVTRLHDDRLALGRDHMSILINADGDPTQKEPINWSDIPCAMGKLYPPSCLLQVDSSV